MTRAVATRRWLIAGLVASAWGCVQSVQILDRRDAAGDAALADAGPADAAAADASSLAGAPFGPPRFLFQASGLSLPDGELELYCVVDDELMVSRRNGLVEPWGALVPVFELNSPAIETDPSISGDGETMIFTSYRDGGDGDLFVSTRASPSAAARWAPPRRIDELSTTLRDCCAVLNPTATVVLLASFQSGDADIYRAERDDLALPWTTPVLVPELSIPSADDLPAHWRGDLLVMDSTRAGQGRDIYLAAYPPAQGGIPIEPIASVNGPGNDRDAWLSVDGRRLYFQSDREGVERLYLAER